jgi:hypothetical protein
MAMMAITTSSSINVKPLRRGPLAMGGLQVAVIIILFSNAVLEDCHPLRGIQPQKSGFFDWPSLTDWRRLPPSRNPFQHHARLNL